MADLVLSLTCSQNDRVMPLITGEVKPVGITLEFTPLPVPDTFYRQLKFQQFDVSEMSFSSFLRARAQGWGYQMLPVFHNRQFWYTQVMIRKDAGIRQDHPEDLRGKRIGTADYVQTMALCTRGILENEFGVLPTDSTWYQERTERFSHSGATPGSGFTPPPGLDFHYAPYDLGTMFLRGELDAAASYQSGASIDRPKVDLSHDDRFTTLFSDPVAESTRYFKKTGVYPPHHTTIIRESIVEKHPWVPLSLMEAFERSKRVAIERLKQRPPTLMVFAPLWLRQVEEIFGSDDPWPYGINANAKAIDMIQTFSVQQGLTERKQPWDELFPEELLLSEERLRDVPEVPAELATGGRLYA